MDRSGATNAVWPDADIDDKHFRLLIEPRSEAALPVVDGLLAGAAEIDITPPPGMPKSGHSKNATDGRGFRTRLKARAVHLRSGQSSVVLIALDLLAGSAVIHHELARQLADTDVPLSGIFLAATHTHAGPGQYSGSQFYNVWASNRPGFDPGYAEFLVAQLRAAVREAVATRRPAHAAIGVTEVWGLTRNRSLPAYVRNAEVSDRRTEVHRKYAAVDPRLHLLRVDDASGPMAAFSWFSIHGTGISSHDASYNADVWAYLNGELADRVSGATGRRPISGAVVASHGDMTPAVRPGMLVFPEAERIGRGIGAAAAELHARLGASLSDQFTVRSLLRQVPLSDAPVVDGAQLAAPRIGWAKTAGAEENETAVLHRLPPFKAGVPRRPHGPQAEKRIAGTNLFHPWFVGRDEDFPQVLPLHLLQLGDAAVLGLPFETTVESGRRIGAAVLASGLEVDKAFVSSLVNDHCDYLTTAEEYSAQHYEGASTLFGPGQQRWVAGMARRVADDLALGLGSEPVGRSFAFSVHRYLAAPTGSAGTRTLGTTGFVEATTTEDAFWELSWTDVSPGDLHWHEPLVRVEVERDGTWTTAIQDDRPVDDQGWRIGVTYDGRDRGQHRYRARWFAPPLGRPGRHRFVLLANNGQPETPGQPFD
jgi:neutral ceramidase